MAENRKTTGHLYYFSRGQLAVIAAGFTVTSVVIFFLGMLIGQGIEERKLFKQEEPLVKIPVQPLASGSKSGASPRERMTFYDTLAKAPHGQQGRRKKKTKRTVKPGVKKEKSPVKVEAKLSTRKTAAPEKVSAQRGNTEARELVWSVQVNAYPHQTGAKSVAKKLKSKGYDAYVVPITIRGRTWHRVRVGHFASRVEARKLEKTLKGKEKFPKSFTTSQ
ncbi:MAG: SPOR domain-containing protein [Candidatus Binatia bacterium]